MHWFTRTKSGDVSSPNSTSNMGKGIDGNDNAKLKKEKKELAEQIKVKEKEINILKQTIQEIKENSKQELAKYENERIEILKEKEVKHYFYSEVMVTAGPRKKSGKDIDFGEDTCGIVQAEDRVLFWLLDGTSDQDSHFATHAKAGEVEVFSSRLMVQSIAKALPGIFRDNQNLNTKEITRKTIKQVAKDWVSRYNERKILKEGENLKCGTTMIIGVLDIKGNLDAFVVGDSKLLLFDANQEFKAAEEDTGTSQDFVAEVVQNQLYLFTGKNDKNMREQGALAVGKHINCKDVWSIICHSDGISERRSNLMKKRRVEGLGAMRESLGKIPLNTMDDKSLLIVEITNC